MLERVCKEKGISYEEWFENLKVRTPSRERQRRRAAWACWAGVGVHGCGRGVVGGWGVGSLRGPLQHPCGARRKWVLAKCRGGDRGRLPLSPQGAERTPAAPPPACLQHKNQVHVEVY